MNLEVKVEPDPQMESHVMVAIEDFRCPICLMVRPNLYCPTACMHSVCYTCHQKNIKGDRFRRTAQCPICCQDYETQHWIPNAAFNRIINGLTAKCQYEDCTWKGLIAEYTQHFAYCNFRIVPCRNRECDWSGPCVKSSDHSATCKYQLIKCKWCEFSYVRGAITMHEDNCVYRLAYCSDCYAGMQFWYMDKHTCVVEEEKKQDMDSTSQAQPIAKQPVEGKPNHGGSDIGRMERDLLQLHGASYLINQMFPFDDQLRDLFETAD